MTSDGRFQCASRSSAVQLAIHLAESAPVSLNEANFTRPMRRTRYSQYGRTMSPLEYRVKLPFWEYKYCFQAIGSVEGWANGHPLPSLCAATMVAGRYPIWQTKPKRIALTPGKEAQNWDYTRTFPYRHTKSCRPRLGGFRQPKSFAVRRMKSSSLHLSPKYGKKSADGEPMGTLALPPPPLLYSTGGSRRTI